MKRSLFAVLFTLMTFMATAQQVIQLYENGVPNSKPSTLKEHQELGEDGILRISNVISPELIVFRPPPAKANGTAVIICPGGGYQILAFDHEGTDVAKVLNEWGVTAFVLKYRLPNDATMQNKAIGPLQDAQRAIQMVRNNAQQWNIKSDQIGIMGFSAGGHLASTAGTHFNKAFIENRDSVSLRPDFMVLVYPVISFSPSIGHTGSQKNLLGNDPTAKEIINYSNELQVTPQTPTTFLVHSSDDSGVAVQNSLVFYQELQKRQIPAALHIYPHGGHGFGIDNPTTKDKWMERLKHWMAANGWLSVSGNQ